MFDIETVPDAELGRRATASTADDKQVGYVMLTAPRGDRQRVPALEQQRVVAISSRCARATASRSGGSASPTRREEDLIRRFFDGIEKYSPDLVSWNGAGFDLPVLHYRVLRHGIAAPRYWETGDATAFRWNNYLSRYHCAPRRPDGRAVGLPGAWAREPAEHRAAARACPASSA